MKYREAIAEVLTSRLEKEPLALIMGAGVADPKGVFGTTIQAHNLYPNRVIETPLSENMLTGACMGLALEGRKPIFTHARADFSVLSWEHIINTGAKIPFLHPELDFNVTIRMLVGRGWGQGPVHSQAFHQLFASVPGVKVFYPVEASRLHDLYARAFAHQGVSVVFEPRRVYELTTVGCPRIDDRAEAQILTFGDCAIDASAAARELRYEGTVVNVVPWEELGEQPSGLSHQLPTLYVDTYPFIPPVLEDFPFRGAFRWLTPPFTACPMAAELELEWYPSKEQIKGGIMMMLGKPYAAPSGVKTVESVAQRGPF